MRSFKWTGAHEVYVAELDGEHRELFRLAEEMRRAVERGDDPKLLRALWKQLGGEVAAHFAHEERLMRENSYPGREWHERQHATASSALASVTRRLERGRMEAVPDALEFLALWLRDHTAVADRMMAAHLRNSRRIGLARAS